jgi:hypothetical protein
MDSIREYEEAVTGSLVQVRMVEGLDHERVFTEIDSVLPAILSLTRSRASGLVTDHRGVVQLSGQFARTRSAGTDVVVAPADGYWAEDAAITTRQRPRAQATIETASSGLRPGRHPRTVL